MTNYRIVWLGEDMAADLNQWAMSGWRLVHVELIGSRYRAWLERVIE